MHAKSLQLCLTLYDPMTIAHQSPLSMGFPRQEYWSGLHVVVVSSAKYTVGEMSRGVESIYEEVALFIYFIFITFYFILEHSQLKML